MFLLILHFSLFKFVCFFLKGSIFHGSLCIQFISGVSTKQSPISKLHQILNKPLFRCQIANRSNNRIEVFSSNGVFLFNFGTGGSLPGQFDRPSSVCCDTKNRAVIVDKDNHRIQVKTFLTCPLVFRRGWPGAAVGEFSRECCTRYSIFPSSSSVKLLDSSSSSNTSRVRRVSRVNRVLLEVLEPKFLTKHRVNSRANFPTRYSTRIDSI